MDPARHGLAEAVTSPTLHVHCHPVSLAPVFSLLSSLSLHYYHLSPLRRDSAKVIFFKVQCPESLNYM